MDRILNMILRRLMNKGLTSGLRAITKRGQRGTSSGAPGGKRDGPNQKIPAGLRETGRMLRRLIRFKL